MTVAINDLREVLSSFPGAMEKIKMSTGHSTCCITQRQIGHLREFGKVPLFWHLACVEGSFDLQLINTVDGGSGRSADVFQTKMVGSVVTKGTGPQKC